MPCAVYPRKREREKHREREIEREREREREKGNTSPIEQIERKERIRMHEHVTCKIEIASWVKI